MNIRMSDELIDLMEMILVYHGKYQSDIHSFRRRFDFEIYYWWNLRKLKEMIDNEFESIRPFTNKDPY